MMPLVWLALLPVLALAAPDDDARLARGEIILTTRPVAGNDIPESTVRAVVDAPPDVVWSIVSDCANYKTTMPSIADSRVVSSVPPTEREGPDAVEVKTCRVVAHLPFPFPDLVSVTRGVHTIVPGKKWQRAWMLVEGDYDRNQGRWLLEPAGDKTLVTYTIDAKPKVFLPAGLVAAIQQGKLPELMQRVRAKAAAVIAARAPH